MTLLFVLLNWLRANWLSVLLTVVAGFFITNYFVRGAKIDTLEERLTLEQAKSAQLVDFAKDLKAQLGVQNAAVVELGKRSASRSAEAEAAVAAVAKEAALLTRSANRLLHMPVPPGDPCVASSELVGL